ncbi:MAG TPA: PEP-CTERM sorting domain-containing protein [Phycisphaerae bacterium]|nr:PEP-CTERM sorting domain-containing protein [Phycisphaerae bacterium]
MKTTWWLLGVAALVALPAGPAGAWIITQIDPATSSGYAGSTVVMYDTDPNVDVIEIHKYFIRDPNGETMPVSLQLMFTREPNDADTITIIDEFILNLQIQDNRTWQDFHVALLTEPNVVLRGGGVEFVNPGGATAWQQTGGETRLDGVPISFSATQVDWLTSDPNQAVPPGGFADAPVNQLVLRGLAIDASDLETGESFILKEWPTVPEPGTLVLLTAAGLVAALRKRRDRR